jgi:cell division protein FtsZ
LQVIKKFTSIDEVSHNSNNDIFKPSVAVIGIGGAGTNAVNNMINMELGGVKFVVINTDGQSLERSGSPHKIQIGPKVTKGLGAGSKPEIGIQAAEESIEDIKVVLEGINLLFITCGMGGGTGTGASQVVAKVAKDLGILTMAFVTKPFDFEGSQRLDIANLGISQLEHCVDSLVLISNQSLFGVINDKTSLVEAFRETDKVLFSGIKAITDLIVSNGLVNLDFNDIKSVIEGMGRTMIGNSEATGENRAELVANEALHNNLLEDSSLYGAKKVLINITGGDDMTLHEVDFIIHMIKKELAEDAFINFGTVNDNNLDNRIRLSIVATGIDTNQNKFKPSSIFSRKDQISTLAKVEHTSIKEQPSAIKHAVYEEPQEEAIEPISEELLNEPSLDNTEDFVEKAKTNNKKITEKESEIEEHHFSNLINKNVQARRNNEEKIKRNIEQNEEDEENEQEQQQEHHTEQENKKDSLFDIIARNKIAHKKDEDKSINEDDIISIKNRNKLSKVNSSNNSKEDSFFDLPSFLKKK